MNKTELLAELAADCKFVYPTVTEVATVNGVKSYAVETEQVEGLSKIRGKTVTFKVFDEGTANEEAFYIDGQPTLPKGENEVGMGYLVAYVLGGTRTILGQQVTIPAGVIINFELKSSRADLGPFGFFDVEVMKNNGDGTVTPEMWRVQYDGDGNPYHAVINGR